jgi:hypothetical protein
VNRRRWMETSASAWEIMSFCIFAASDNMATTCPFRERLRAWPRDRILLYKYMGILRVCKVSIDSYPFIFSQDLAFFL